jgi:proteasome activator subunit 2 (PA28 beta)
MIPLEQEEAMNGRSDGGSSDDGDGDESGKTMSFGAICSEDERLKMIRSELAELQREIHDSIQLATDVKLWLQLNIPRIEDGNNFGVGIQEGVVQELSKSEEAGMAALEGLGRWWQGRSKLIGKVIKYGSPLSCKDKQSVSPSGSHLQHGRHLCANCQFLPRDPLIYAIIDSDRRFLGNIWMGWCDLRNNYAVLYDMLAKNLEKIVNPRSENAINMY